MTQESAPPYKVRAEAQPRAPARDFLGSRRWTGIRCFSLPVVGLHSAPRLPNGVRGAERPRRARAGGAARASLGSAIVIQRVNVRARNLGLQGTTPDRRNPDRAQIALEEAIRGSNVRSEEHTSELQS